MNKKTFFLIVVGIVILIGGFVAYNMWNKPHRDVTHEKAIPVTAVALFKDYSANEQAANAKYLNKAMEVTGTVSSIDTNQDGGIAVILQTEDVMSGIKCTMRDKNVSVVKGNTVTVEGFCNGFVSDVILSDCVVKQ